MLLALRPGPASPCLQHLSGLGPRLHYGAILRAGVAGGGIGTRTIQHEGRRRHIHHHRHHQHQHRRRHDHHHPNHDFGSRLSRPLPRGTWDSHMHVVDPTRFPLATDAQYTPSPHTLADARAFYARFHWPIENMVLVQPSIYGADNSCMLEALRELTPRHGRAVVGLDLDLAGATTTTTTKGKSKSKDKDRYIDTLYEWHDLGVRGARVNLVSVGRDLSEAELCAELETYATLLRPLDWVLQLFIPMRLAVALESIVPDLGVRVCIDHFGWPALPKSEPYDPSTPTDPYALTGFRSLVNLLKKGQGQGNGNGNGKGQGNDNGSSNGKGNGKGQTWVKLSAPYRLARDPDMRDLDPIGRELVFQAPDRIVYATDWPHTRFDNVDPVPFVEKCFEWCGGDPVLIEKLFRTNAEQLWDIPGRKVTKSPQIETT